MTDARVKLCDLSEIAEGDSNGFTAERDGKPIRYIVVRKNAEVYVYINSCPHVGAPLDLIPGRFLSPDKSLILCSSHGALFRLEDGFCVSGPCAEQALSAAPFEIREGALYLC